MAPDDSCLVQVRDLAFAYDGAAVLSVDSLGVHRQSITALIGPNGCGKTTLFKIINGLLGPYRGSVTFAGREVSQPSGRRLVRRRSIYVHQKPYIFRERVRDNIGFALRVRGVDSAKRPERIAAAMDAVGISGLASRPGGALSGGERQRLAVARALALEPELLILDEPTSNIDPDSVGIIEAAIETARESGVTVLISTHNLATAYRTADTILPMEAGSLQALRENVYRGHLEAGENEVGHFVVEGSRALRLAVPPVSGAYRAAVVPMDDVILSTQKVASSAQNLLPGTVRKLTDLQGLVRVDLDCGIPLSALVTRTAVAELSIAPGRDLFAGFKASAVRLY